MTTTKRLGLIAVLTLLSAALPWISHAQFVYGSWTGIEEYTSEVVLADGQIVGYYSGSGPATFTMSVFAFPNMVMEIDGNPPAFPIYAFGTLSPQDAFGPQSRRWEHGRLYWARWNWSWKWFRGFLPDLPIYPPGRSDR